MRQEIIRCDTCKKEHDAQYMLPDEWIVISKADGFGNDESMHFCSKSCLITWANEVPDTFHSEAWGILKELSESNGTPFGSMGHYCLFCHAKDNSLSNVRHKDTCIISKAYKLVWEKENREWHEQHTKQA